MVKRTKRSGKNPQNGDIPRAVRHTYETASCPLPRTSDQCTIRGAVHSKLSATATVNATGVYYFSLSASGISSGPFDQYRINCIRFTIASQNNAIGLVTNSTTSLVPLYFVIDYDDATALSTEADALQYNNVVVIHPGESASRLFRPRMAVAAYTGSFTGYTNMEPLWLDAASSSIQHYGVKVLIPGAAASQTLLQTWDVTIEYWIDFRNAI